jgi:hypothetical protein
MSRPPDPEARILALVAELGRTREYLVLLGDRLVDAHCDLDQHIADPAVPLEAWTAGIPPSRRARDHVLAIERDLDHAIDLARAFEGTTRPLGRALAHLQNQLCDTCLSLGVDILDCLEVLHEIEAAIGNRRGRLRRARANRRG